MNILPKKRWHVRNQDNKERVRKDEENARLEQKKEEERIALAEQEARMSFLRRQKGVIKNVAHVEDKTVALQEDASQHLNLFATEEEAGGIVQKDNEEYIKEKRKEKESYEQKIGLLTYVGQSAAEGKKQDERPWYLQKRKREKTEELKSSEKEIFRKSRLDPMSIVEESLKEKKRKKKKKKIETSPPRKSSKTIEMLREERLKREKIERHKAEQLLRQDQGESTCGIELDRSRYSNQFNPEIARRRKFDRHHPY